MAIQRGRRFAGSRCVTLAGVLLVVAGCSQLGIRPDKPPVATNVCADFRGEVEYAEELQTAYHSRASLNRFSIYAGGILALGTAAAAGGLGAAGVAAVTLTYLSISGGFASGALAIVDNEALADVYTIYANKIAEGLQAARPVASSRDPNVCAPALANLVAAVTNAEKELERARTDKAVLAATHAKEQLKKLETALSSTTTTITLPVPTTTAPPGTVTPEPTE